MRTRTLVAVCAGAAFFAMALTAAVATPLIQGIPAAGVAATPEQAISIAMQAIATSYAGDCAAAISPNDIGKTCSKFVAQRGGMRAYLTGQTFSEFTTWMFVEQTTGGWRFVATAPLDESAMTLNVPWPAA